MSAVIDIQQCINDYMNKHGTMPELVALSPRKAVEFCQEVTSIGSVWQGEPPTPGQIYEGILNKEFKFLGITLTIQPPHIIARHH